MRDFQQPAEVITWVPAADVESGQIVVLPGGLAGVSAGKYKAGADNAELLLEGGFTYAKALNDTWALGTKLFYNSTTNQIAATGTVWIGHAILDEYQRTAEVGQPRASFRLFCEGPSLTPVTPLTAPLAAPRTQHAARETA